MLLAGLLLGYLPSYQLVPSVIVAGSGLILVYGVAAAKTDSSLHRIIDGSLRNEQDGQRKLHFFFPFTLFLGALIVVAIYMPLDYVRVAFFTVAVADGLAEPVGLKYGKGCQYHVPDICWGGVCSRSLAGSLAVFIISFAIVLFLVQSPLLWNFKAATLYGVLIALLEAASPKGFDNALIMAFGPLILSGLD